MIILKTFGTDSNPAADSLFVGIPKPIGVQDGDLLLVGIALPIAGLTVTPPSTDWIQITTTDPTFSVGITAFYKSALNEPNNWVFQLSSSTRAAGTVMVYGNTDSFSPVEAFSAVLTDISVTQNIGAVSSSIDAEEIVLFAMGGASGTFTPSGGFIEVARKQTTLATIEAQHKFLQVATNIPISTETFSVIAKGASLIIVLKPGVGTLTVDNARELLIAGFPVGVENVYDLTTTGDYYKYLQALAANFKIFGYDFIDLLRLEIIPYLSFYELPAWEKIFGLEFSRISKLGTVPQRQAQILSAWRSAAGQDSSIPTVKAVLGPILGYFPSTNVQVIEANRAALTAAHTYTGPVPVIPAPGSTSVAVDVADGGIVSTGGATLKIVITAAILSDITLTLTSPANEIVKIYPSLGTGSIVSLSETLHGKEFVGAIIDGIWTLGITNAGAGAASLTWALFVEGVQNQKSPPEQNTGAAIYDWGVYADPAHIAENGSPADFDAARAAIRKIAFSHTIANLLQSLDPWPDTNSGVHSSIPNECIPI